MTEQTQKESKAIYDASRQNIYYNLLLDLRDLGYKPKEIVDITDVNPNTLRGQLYKAKDLAPSSGLDFMISSTLNYLYIHTILDKTNKNSLLEKIESFRESLVGLEETIQSSLTEADIEEKVEQITEEMETGDNPESEPEASQEDFDPKYPGSTEEAPWGFTQEGQPRKMAPRNRKRKRR